MHKHDRDAVLKFQGENAKNTLNAKSLQVLRN